MAFSLTVVLSTFGIIFIAELPDKTALATLILSTRYRAKDVIIGVGLAFLVQTVIAVAAGSFLTLLPAQPIRILSGLGFLVFAGLAFRRNMQEDAEEEGSDIARTQSRRPIWLVSFLVIFAAEWGDLTQLATAALVARTGEPVSVGTGALFALWAVTVIAAFSGSQITNRLKPKYLNLASGLLFAGFGAYVLYSSWPW